MSTQRLASATWWLARTSQLLSSLDDTPQYFTPIVKWEERSVWCNWEVPAKSELEKVDDFLQRWRALPHKQKHGLTHEIPLSDMQTAAVHHPDPWVRRAGLFFLDHYANDTSTHTFLAALGDPVTPVRELALHGLACEQCRAVELCVADVVPVLSRVIESDTSAEVRHKAIPILLRLSGRDARARAALEVAASSDDDPLVRQAPETRSRAGTAMLSEAVMISSGGQRVVRARRSLPPWSAQRSVVTQRKLKISALNSGGPDSPTRAQRGENPW
jgi:hypothetical protein